ncbi:uncharacterized protein LOC143895074 [Temnothorax americanus]|uniref:uncharacterized protein LOC143895074 n=1 Tax=Temnothorax americanus TaxID=1964332 RepID=UPI00406856B4
MASFWSRLQIFSLLSLNNKHNPRLKQHSWHYAYNRRSISTLSKRSERYYGLKKKTRGTLSFQTALSTKTNKFAGRKSTLWEYAFGPKRSSKKHVCQLAERQEQTRSEEDYSRCRATPGDVPVYTDSAKSSKDSRRLVEPRPKPPPSYKLPRAVLLSRAMVEGFAEKGADYESKTMTPTASRKLYEEMRPASNTKGIAEYRENVIGPSVDVEPREKSTSRRVSIPINAHRVATAKILRQATSREEPRIHSRIEQLKILVNEKITKSRNVRRE